MLRFFALGFLLQSHGNQVEAIQVSFFCFVYCWVVVFFTHIHKIYSLLLDLGENRRRRPPRHHVL